MTVSIHGKDYVTVAERVAMVHESGKAFEIVASEPLQVGDRWLWRVVVKIDDRQYIGTAEAKVTNARNGSPDASNPFECAETSAIGRALGFAGFGAIESIASADEIVRGQANGRAVQEGNTKPTEQQIASIRKLCEHLKQPVPLVANFEEAKDWIAKLSQEYRTMRQKTAASGGGK